MNWPWRSSSSATIADAITELTNWVGRTLRAADSHVFVTTIGPSSVPNVISPDIEPVTPGSTNGHRGVPVIGPEPALIVRPPRRPAWDEQGWRERHVGGRTLYEGEYVIRARSGARRTFPGRIVVEGAAVVPYIADPPAAIKRHPKGPCFQLTQPPWFRVHWRTPATNVDDALLYVERVLHEVLK